MTIIYIVQQKQIPGLMLKFVEPENSETTLQMLSGKFYVNVCVESANVAVEQAIKSDQENELIEQNTQFFVYLHETMEFRNTSQLHFDLHT